MGFVDPNQSVWMLLKVLLGFGASYGIFQEYYSTNEPFAGSRGIAIVGACAQVIVDELGSNPVSDASS